MGNQSTVALKTELFYFTGTGNSLYIARKINEALTHPGELLPIAIYINSTTVYCDAVVVGIIFPIHMGSAPNIVKEFVTKLKIRKTPYVFAVATYNSHVMNSMALLSEIMRTNSIDLALGETVNMPGNAKKSSSEDNENRLKASRQRVIDIVNKVNSRIIEPQEISPKIIKKVTTGKIKSPMLPTNFKASPSCNGCGTCQKICPMANINMADNKPVWGNNCATCLACFHWCPRKSVKWGLPIIGNRPQYHHPEIKVTDISKQQLTFRY